jgi:hypothetical protein
MSLIYDDTYGYDTANITFEGVGPINNAYTDPNIAYRSTTASYQGAVVKQETASGSGAGGSSVTYTTVDVSAIYRGYRNHYTAYRQSDVLYTGEKGAAAVGSGTSTGSAVGVNIIPRTATGTGGATAGDTATGLRTAVDAATGAGAGSQTAIGLRTAIETGSGSGVGTHTIVSAKASLRQSTSAGVGGSSVDAFTTTFKTATSAGVGSLDVALWKNAGKSLDLLVVLPPKWSKRKPYTVPQ